MNDVVIWHNPRCSKSRSALALLEERGIKPDIFEYLSEPLSEDMLRSVLSRLKLRPQDIVRTQEEVFKAFRGKKYSNDEWLRILVDNPKLIERPIVIHGKRAVVGRPPEEVLKLF